MPVKKNGMLWLKVPCGLKPRKIIKKIERPVVQDLPEPIDSIQIEVLPLVSIPEVPEIIETIESKVVLVKEVVKEEVVKQLEAFEKIIEDIPKVIVQDLDSIEKSIRSEFACEFCDYVGKNARTLTMHKRAKHE